MAEHYKEPAEYRKHTGAIELHKAVNTLRGIVAGITSDGVTTDDEIAELSHWLSLHAHLEPRHPFTELIPFVRRALKDGTVDEEEAKDILWLCGNFVSDAAFYDIATSSLQFLSGIVHGMLADGTVSDDEIKRLEKWLSENSFLSGFYPFDEIESLVLSITMDGTVTDEEREMLESLLSEFVDTTVSYNIHANHFAELRKKHHIDGICAAVQEIEFKGRAFCFTGQSEKAKRDDIVRVIEALGGIFKTNISPEVRYLVVGKNGSPAWAYACYGRKIEEAENLRREGIVIQIISEVDFWDCIEDVNPRVLELLAPSHSTAKGVPSFTHFTVDEAIAVFESADENEQRMMWNLLYETIYHHELAVGVKPDERPFTLVKKELIEAVDMPYIAVKAYSRNEINEMLTVSGVTVFNRNMRHNDLAIWVVANVPDLKAVFGEIMAVRPHPKLEKAKRKLYYYINRKFSGGPHD